MSSRSSAHFAALPCRVRGSPVRRAVLVVMAAPRSRGRSALCSPTARRSTAGRPAPSPPRAAVSAGCGWPGRRPAWRPARTSNCDWWHGHSRREVCCSYSEAGQPACVQILENATYSGLADGQPKPAWPLRDLTFWPGRSRISSVGRRRVGDPVVAVDLLPDAREHGRDAARLQVVRADPAEVGADDRHGPFGGNVFLFGRYSVWNSCVAGLLDHRADEGDQRARWRARRRPGRACCRISAAAGEAGVLEADQEASPRSSACPPRWRGRRGGPGSTSSSGISHLAHRTTPKPRKASISASRPPRAGV